MAGRAFVDDSETGHLAVPICLYCGTHSLSSLVSYVAAQEEGDEVSATCC